MGREVRSRSLRQERMGRGPQGAARAGRYLFQRAPWRSQPSSAPTAITIMGPAGNSSRGCIRLFLLLEVGFLWAHSRALATGLQGRLPAERTLTGADRYEQSSGLAEPGGAHAPPCRREQPCSGAKAGSQVHSQASLLADCLPEQAGLDVGSTPGFSGDRKP